MGVPEGNASLWIVCTEMVQIFLLRGAFGARTQSIWLSGSFRATAFPAIGMPVFKLKTCQATIGVRFPQIKMIEILAMGFGKVPWTR